MPPPQTQTCAHCGKSFRTRRLNGPTAKRFCSKPCQQRWHYERRQRVLQAAGLTSPRPKVKGPPRRRRGKWVWISAEESGGERKRRRL